MQNILKNWKTSLAGVVIIGIAALHTFAGVNIPGAMDISQALTVGVQLRKPHGLEFFSPETGPQPGGRQPWKGPCEAVTSPQRR